MNSTPLVMGMMLYPGFTMLDLVGPMTVFTMHARIHLLWRDLDPVVSDSGVAMVPTTRLADCPERLDLLFVPGGFGTPAAMEDAELLAFLRLAGERSDYIASVCGGALVLAAAGLLDGYKATTHWAMQETLGAFGDEAAVAATRV